MCFVFFSISGNLYIDVDNFNVSVITNGLYDADNYCSQLHPLLCWIIGIISAVVSTADAFSLLAHILIFFAIVLLSYIIIRNEKNDTTKWIYISLVVALSVILCVWNVNYTVQAAFFTMVGIIVIYWSKQNKSVGVMISGTVFVSVGIMWRIQGALLFLPFVILEICIEILFEDKFKKNSVHVMLKYWGMLIVILVALVSSKYLNDVSEKYYESILYNEARTVIEDYPMLAWEQVEGTLQNVTRTEYNAAKGWILCDTANLSLGTLQEIANAGTTLAYPLTIEGLFNIIKDMLLFAIRNGWQMWVWIVVIFLLVCRILCSNVRWYRKVESGLVLAGGMIILFYFTLKGRAPLRVWQSVFLAEISVLMIEQFFVRTNRLRRSSLLGVIICVVLCGGSMIKFGKASYHMPQFAIDSRVDVDDTLYKKTYRESDLYLWDSWHKHVTRNFMMQGKLPTKEFLNHNISIGDWTYGQVYYTNYLQSLNAENPAEALLSKDNVYYASSDCSVLLKYMKEQYNENLEVKQIGEINGVPVWCFFENE